MFVRNATKFFKFSKPKLGVFRKVEADAKKDCFTWRIIVSQPEILSLDYFT